MNLNDSTDLFSRMAHLLDRPHVKRTWRPLQALSRALIVGTFVDDFVRIASDYTGQADSMRTVGFGEPASSILPALFCAVQGIGAGLVLSGQARFVQIGCVVLISWSAAHPFLYQQQRNTEFVVEEVSIIGGLLILLSSTRATLRSSALPVVSQVERQTETDRLQLAGRCCLSALYLFYAQKMARERFAALNDGFTHENLPATMTEIALLVMLLPLTAWLVIGLRSRWCRALSS
jgi:hypothetical protein